MRSDGGRGGLSVSAGDSHCGLIIFHYLSDHLRSFHHGDASSDALGILRIVWVDRRGIYDNIDVVSYVLGKLRVGYIHPETLQMLGDGTFGAVGTGDLKTHRVQELGEAAHAYPADPDEVDVQRMCIVERFLEIDCEHFYILRLQYGVLRSEQRLHIDIKYCNKSLQKKQERILIVHI